MRGLIRTGGGGQSPSTADSNGSAPFALWSTNDAAGPTLTYNTIGFNNSGGATSTCILHAYNATTDTWTASTQTFDGFVGL